jgi:hypothetical protein
LRHRGGGFFDHLLRNAESYGLKWNYGRENPVRAGLIKLGVAAGVSPAENQNFQT